jgi:hypothetical protein
MNSQDLAQSVQYDGDAIAQIFINALTECNFHTEAKVIHAVWEAMAYTDSSDSQKLIDAAARVLAKIEA